MTYYSLPTGKLHKNTKTKKLPKIPASYESRFYKTLMIRLINRLIRIFRGMLFQKHLATMLKIIFLEQVISEKVCKTKLICTPLGIG